MIFSVGFVTSQGIQKIDVGNCTVNLLSIRNIIPVLEKELVIFLVLLPHASVTGLEL